jgi:hypothetical protein
MAWAGKSRQLLVAYFPLSKLSGILPISLLNFSYGCASNSKLSVVNFICHSSNTVQVGKMPSVKHLYRVYALKIFLTGPKSGKKIYFKS